MDIYSEVDNSIRTSENEENLFNRNWDVKYATYCTGIYMYITEFVNKRSQIGLVNIWNLLQNCVIILLEGDYDL